MKNIILISLTICFSSFIKHDEFVEHKVVEGNFKHITVDNMNNVYVIKNNDQVVKLGSDGQELNTYSTKRYGKLNYVIALNPLKILLFYSNYATIVILDNYLAENGIIELQNINMIKVSALGLSFDNNIWLFDELDFKLKKINDNSQIIQSSEDLSNMIGHTIKPNFILESNNNVYLNDPEYGIINLDIFGNYIKTIPIKGLSTFNIINNQIVYHKNNQIETYHLLTLEDGQITLKDTTDIKQVYLNKAYLYLLKESKLKIYKH